VLRTLDVSEFTNPVITGLSEAGSAWLKWRERLGAVTISAFAVICPEIDWFAKE
jgi:hypothetical protein